MQNKRGAIHINTIILLVLGFVVMVLLILGLTGVWNPWKDIVKPGNNVDTISRACSVACTTQGIYDFCSKERTLKAPDMPEENGEEIKEKKGNCSFFATTTEPNDYTKYGIVDCPGLCD